MPLVGCPGPNGLGTPAWFAKPEHRSCQGPAPLRSQLLLRSGCQDAFANHSPVTYKYSVVFSDRVHVPDRLFGS